MALGTTSCTQEIYDAFLSGDKSKTFFHGHSFTANPLACAAACASMDIFDKPETWENIKRIEQRENDTLIAIKHIKNKFDNLPLKVVYAIENEDKIIITAYPLKRIHKLKDHESKL